MKTTKIDSFATVKEVGYMCCRGMAWESPYVVFSDTTDGHGPYIWHSDNVEPQLNKLGFRDVQDLRGIDVGVSLLVRGNRVWRVKRLYRV